MPPLLPAFMVPPVVHLSERECLVVPSELEACRLEAQRFEAGHRRRRNAALAVAATMAGLAVAGCVAALTTSIASPASTPARSSMPGAFRRPLGLAEEVNAGAEASNISNVSAAFGASDASDASNTSSAPSASNASDASVLKGDIEADEEAGESVDEKADEEAGESADEKDGACSKKWDQCGGKGFSGRTCCEEGTECAEKPLPHLASYRQCLPLSGEDSEVGRAPGGGGGGGGGDGGGKCAKLWSQCGGEGYEGPECCEEDNICTKKPLENLPTYRQCRPPPPPACEDPPKGSTCHTRLLWDKNVGIFQNPTWYHGLTEESDLKEFQEYEYMLNRNQSQCKPPCAPGTCFFVFRFEGCDSINEWTCEEPNDSLAYKCCCEYFHDRVNKTKPENPTPALMNAMNAFTETHPTLFCTAMMMPSGYEVELMRAQYSNGLLGLFGCDDYAVYSNHSIRLSPKGEVPEVTTGLINGSLTGVIGGEFHTVLNTEVFLKFWKLVLEHKAAFEMDWIVKLDPDTVFIPLRLKALLLTNEGPLGEDEPEKGIFLNNCHVGMHGPIEVLSVKALETFRDGHEKCEEGKPAERGQEDWYLRDCFHELGIQKVDAYNVLLEGTLACQERPSSWHPYRPPCFSPQVAFHPFKSVESYMHCFNETANHPYALPTEAISVGPRHSNELHG